jgi:hypothetical protein
MASASLVHPVPVDHGTAYEVETWPFECPPFAGAPSRDWSSFELAGPEEARFEWRTRADRILAAVRALAAGATAESVVADEVVAGYVARVAASVPGMPPATPPELAAAILPGLSWSDLVDPAGPWSAYRRDDESFLEEAAAALELPDWAGVRRMPAASGGGRKVVVVLDDGRSLADLAALLAPAAP